jgi:hypothetical protein
MPNLGDYIGQLMSEIALARMQADLESIRIAELYASHPLLKTLPIPHLRLPEVNLDIPVLIESSEPPREGETPRGGTRPGTLAKRFSGVARRILDGFGIELSAAEHRHLAQMINARVDALWVPDEVAIDVRRVADELSTATIRHLSSTTPRRREPRVLPETLEAVLRDAANREFLSARTPAPRLSARVTSQELQEAGPEGVTRLRLRITEQGLELTTIDGAEGPQVRLTPE